MNYKSWVTSVRIAGMIAFSAIVMSLVVSCDTKTAEPIYIGKEYFPLSSGNWIIYDVDSTVYDDFLGQVFNFKYQVKEVQAGTFISDSGQEKMRIERFFRADSLQSWKINNVWTQYLKENKALRTEENITYVKLSFPLELNRSWNGNTYNTRPSQTYRITDIHHARPFGTHTFDSTLRVLHIDFQTLISKELQYEIYGKGIGMLERHYTDLISEIDGTIISGVKYTFTIREYGNSEPYQ